MDEYAMELDLAGIAKLVDKGAQVALSGSYSNSFAAREDMLWGSAELMRVMHDSEKVLGMLTSIPAQILGIDDKVGSIECGKRADLVIWSANPMASYQARIIRTYQSGTAIYQEGDEMKCL